MRLYSIGQMLVEGPKGGLMRTEGVYFWEIARQSKEGYWVRRHGHPKATTFVPKDKIGTCYFHEPAEVLKWIRQRLRKAIQQSEENTRLLEKEYEAVKKGMVFTKEWSPKSISPMKKQPEKLPMARSAPEPKAKGPTPSPVTPELPGDGLTPAGRVG